MCYDIINDNVVALDYAYMLLYWQRQRPWPSMIELILFVLLLLFIMFLMKKPTHSRNKNFQPEPVSRRFSRNPNNRKIR